MKKTFLILLLSISCLNLSAYALDDIDELFHAVTITDGSILNVSDCVASAFKNSPKIKRQKYNLDITKSNLGIARSQYFPVINAGVGFFNENNSDSVYYNKHYRELPNVGVFINKMVWDFGKTTAYIKMEEFYKIGAEYEFMDSLCSTLFDVKFKYYNLLKTKAMLQVAEKNLEINQDFVKNSKAKVDRATANVYLNMAEAELVDAKNNYYNAKVDLDNAMYLEKQQNYDIKNTKTFDFTGISTPIEEKNFQPYQQYNFPFSRENAPKLAYENSPDLKVLISTKDAMIQSLNFVKRTYLPSINANAGYGFNNTNETSNNSFQVGVSLNSSVNLMELKHSIKGADAQVNLAENEISLFKKDLYYEVKRAFNNFDKAERKIPITQVGINKSAENFKIVYAGYNAGTINYTALQDAREDYIKAISDYAEALYQYNIALIGIEMAMHYHIIDIHHKSEHAMCYHSEELINHLNEVLGCNEHEEHSKKTKKQDL